MGGQPWSYFVAFNTSVDTALEQLQQQIFAAGKYRGSELEPATIEEAVENSAESGTASILDIMMVGDEPDFCTVCPLSKYDLDQLFGTSEPNHEMVAASDELFENIERGQGIYITIYKNGRPSELFFAGYSID